MSDDNNLLRSPAIDGPDISVMLRLSDLPEYAREAVDKMRRAIAATIEQDRAGRVTVERAK
jgi:hypothetical protein